MKKTLSFMVMAFALLFAQCRKPEVKFPSPVAPEGVTVSMTVTAGPGSKTDITADGGITWSSGDRLYVGFDGKYVGCLTLTSGSGTRTGWFSGDVTLTGISEGDEQTFHFFYLGSTERTLEVGETTVDVDFSSQEIYAEDGKLKSASKHHVGYGTAKGTVKDGVVTGINVTMVSKVALARFSFTEAAGKGAYTGPLTLSGTGIYNSMKVNFGGTFTGEKTDGGKINLTNTTTSEKYVMLVPAGTDSKTLNFGGAYEGITTLENGIEANKFYGRESAIEVTVTKYVPKFTVDKDGTTVEFSPGNLYWDGSAFRFEENQWSFASTWNPSHVSHFFWSNTTDWQTSGKEPYASSYSYSTRTTSDEFFTNSSSFQVDGETAGTWRTLTRDEWNYLLGYDPKQLTQTETYGRPGAKAKSAWKDLGGGVKGLVILPDGTDASVMSNITTTNALATSGAVFLPAADSRKGPNIYILGTYGYYWSSTPHEFVGGGEEYAYYMNFNFTGGVSTYHATRDNGYAVRLVR